MGFIIFECVLPYMTFCHFGWKKPLEFLKSYDMVFTSNIWFIKVVFTLYNDLKTTVAIGFIRLKIRVL